MSKSPTPVLRTSPPNIPSGSIQGRGETNIHSFISEKIADAFQELTETVAGELAEEYGADMPVGSLAFEMMAAEMVLQNAWRKHCEERASGSDEVRVVVGP